MNQATVTDKQIDATIVKYTPFFLEIRKRLFFTACLFIIFAVLGFLYYEKIVMLLLTLFALPGINIVFTSPFQFFTLALNCAFLAGFIASFPLLLVQLIGFVKPALSKKEYKMLITIIPVSMVLFLVGFAYGTFIMKLVLMEFFRKSVELSIGNFIDVSYLLSQTLVTATILGIAFQFPILMTLLMRVKLLPYRLFTNQRRIVYGIIIIFVTLLPPTDLISNALIVLPLALLFEFTLVLNRYILKSHLL